MYAHPERRKVPVEDEALSLRPRNPRCTDVPLIARISRPRNRFIVVSKLAPLCSRADTCSYAVNLASRHLMRSRRVAAHEGVSSHRVLCPGMMRGSVPKCPILAPPCSTFVERCRCPSGRVSPRQPTHTREDVCTQSQQSTAAANLFG